MSPIIDLNADIGEQESAQGAAAEREILQYVTSCNIACAAHAGSEAVMRDRVRCALNNSVAIGAHPSYPDRENFGRKSMVLGVDIEPQDLTLSLHNQITLLRGITQDEGAVMHYVKPHGSLYTDAAKSPALAKLIADCIVSIDPKLTLLGPPDSALELAAKSCGLRYVGEGFIDRAYGVDGHLVARSIEGAVITSPEAQMKQMLSLALAKCAVTPDGQSVAVNAASLCLHGDNAGAVATAKAARETLLARGVTLKAFSHED